MAEKLERSEMHFRDQDLRRHAEGHYVWLASAGSHLLNEKGI
jgi:hypothetical protein